MPRVEVLVIRLFPVLFIAALNGGMRRNAAKIEQTPTMGNLLNKSVQIR
jgi:hypothetical protein